MSCMAVLVRLSYIRKGVSNPLNSAEETSLKQTSPALKKITVSRNETSLSFPKTSTKRCLTYFTSIKH